MYFSHATPSFLSFPTFVTEWHITELAFVQRKYNVPYKTLKVTFGSQRTARLKEKFTLCKLKKKKKRKKNSISIRCVSIEEKKKIVGQ